MIKCFLKVPREVVTARLQTEHMKHGVKPSFFPIFKEIMKNEGFPGFFKGFAPILWRDIPFMTILFTTYESFKQFHHISQRSSSLTHFTLYGGISGSIAGFLTTPFDVVRTRIMTGEKGDGTIKICKLLMKEASREEGILRTFYKGSIARSAWWFGVCSLFFPIYENLKDVLAWHIIVKYCIRKKSLYSEFSALTGSTSFGYKILLLLLFSLLYSYTIISSSILVCISSTFFFNCSFSFFNASISTSEGLPKNCLMKLFK